ncbi:Oidioi.mRNA.OKI2018_I69.chr1.g2493.t1.cds [Oikopleura dioica]|uniref:Oidioi.mRNA.OKI2018_I69.chr1.g2493.t1.cds n=1 Tax=Oikopleura dioica TaxID=34765 RepID=A0ABN7SV70_OIKDI|nr:Oidioi.mRNA.OKI2018_I69.chr1.g2493.t1.cds [Oikopleura dioica]
MPKAGIQTTLEKLAKDGLLVEKVYGKTPIYVVNQAQFETVDEEGFNQLKVENDQLRLVVKEKRKEAKDLDAELRKYTTKVSSAELKLKIKEKKESIQALRTQLEQLKEAGATMNADELENSVKNNVKLAKLWKSRKRIGDDMMNAVSEGLQKPMKVFIELADLNLDPEGAAIPKY